MKEKEELLRQLLSSELKGDLLILFRKNPGLMDTPEGIARRLGVSTNSIENDLADLLRLGFLRANQLGKFKVISIDEDKDKAIQETVAGYLSSLREDEKV